MSTSARADVDHTDRVGWLDGLRGIAIICVLIGHLPGLDWLRKPVGYGDAGVVIFFVLSGYLITGILRDLRKEESRSRALRKFYVRRARRIFPIYYLTIGIVFIAGYQPVVENITRLLTYTVNYIPGLPKLDIKVASPMWSLSVEEQFYLLWPWVILFAPERWLKAIVVLLVGFTVALKYALAATGASYDLTFRTVLSCADSLGVGALLTFVPFSRLWAGLLMLAGLALAAGGLLLKESLALDPWYAPLTAVGVAYFHGVILMTAGLIGLAAHAHSLRAMLNFALLRWTGRISYGLYIYHAFLPLALVNTWVEHSRIGTLVCVFAVAGASWFLIEKPLLTRKGSRAEERQTALAKS